MNSNSKHEIALQEVAFRPMYTSNSRQSLLQNGSTFCKIVDKENNTFYEGYIKNGKRNGEGTLVDKNAHVQIKGIWVDDEIHGDGTIKNYRTDYKFCGEFKYSTMYFGKLYFGNGTIYSGYFENNEMNGLGRIRWSDQSEYEGEFKDGKIHGYGIYKGSKKNVIYEGTFHMGKISN
jgi:hypothetical protein